MEIDSTHNRLLARIVPFTILLAVASGLCGCGASVDSQVALTDTAAVASESPVVRLVNAQEFAQEMEQRKGKVVLLDMWATW